MRILSFLSFLFLLLSCGKTEKNLLQIRKGKVPLLRMIYPTSRLRHSVKMKKAMSGLALFAD